jgi:hypothetical protein
VDFGEQNFIDASGYISSISLKIEKPSGQYLALICDESLTCHGLNLNLGYFCGFTFIFVSFGESHLLVLWYAGGRCGMICNDEDCGRSRRRGVDDQGW